ncbi:PRC-barrel domain-containing protein [Chryseolinea lacunae]|uniref:PRC-barrel domain-containing protein n=1 Tax=Chryseolinea lacunae TaxID=2801331 RepID=A0ABS1L080_9BACT|nr:PRC-barrel domain-containing protein [Chryseolinea lacunae]MBL0744307.1 PRC-barrel domain-containing protein [Chryseolinea lacunae]
MKTNLDIDNLTGKNHEGVKANSPVRILTASSIMKDTIEDPQGEKLGDIKDVMLNVETGAIEYIVLESGGFLGLGQKLFAIPYRALRLNTSEHAFVLDLDKEILKEAPGFDKDHWPGTNSHEFESTNTYWGGFMGPNTGSSY